MLFCYGIAIAIYQHTFKKERVSMVKLLGFRITPFFLFILGLECLALLVSFYLGTLLYRDTTTSVSIEFVDSSIYSGLFLIGLIAILTPGFFYQTKVINNVKKSIRDKAAGFIVALITMVAILFTCSSGLDSKTIFIAAILSACAGLVVNQAGLLRKYWRFLVRSGVN
jgi:hypothetical protein